MQWQYSRASARIAGAVILGSAVVAGASACSDTTSPGQQLQPGASRGAEATNGNAATHVVYVLNNDPVAGHNAVLGYRRGDDGSLTPLPGSPFLTGGTGVANPTQMLGPDDVDRPLIATRNRNRLFAVNPGSNTIAAFDVHTDGSLSPVAGSPFPSGGIEPGSLGLSADRLYVVNTAQNPTQPGDALPNYTGFSFGASGALAPIPNSTVTTVRGAAPSIALVSPSRRLLFGADFLAPVTPSHQGGLRGFSIGESGALTPAPGTPQNIPGEPTMRAVLGLATHPTRNVLYVGFVQQSKLGVYTFDERSGALTFHGTAENSGKAICWMVTNRSGSALYTSNTADNSVSVYDLTNPLEPRERQHLLLKARGPLYTGPTGGPPSPTSEALQLALDPEEAHLYVVSQHTNPDFSAPNGNKLHVLTVSADGLLSEPHDPLVLPVETRTRPWGVLVF